MALSLTYQHTPTIPQCTSDAPSRKGALPCKPNRCRSKLLQIEGDRKKESVCRAFQPGPFPHSPRWGTGEGIVVISSIPDLPPLSGSGSKGS